VDWSNEFDPTVLPTTVACVELAKHGLKSAS